MAWTNTTQGRWAVGDDLTFLQLVLHDAGELFPRDELLGWYREGYRQLLARAQSTRQWHILDVPPRYSVTYLYDWERSTTRDGTSRQVGYRGPSGSVYTYAWELEQGEGVPVTDGAAVLCTQLWEYAYTLNATTDETYTFAVPRSHERIARVYWDNKALVSRAVRELDGTEAFWWREQGEPWIWARGTQGPRHFDLYQLQAGYQQGYELRDATQETMVSYSYSFPWEHAYSPDGSMGRAIGYQGSSGTMYTYAWELAEVEGGTAVDAATALCTQLWEYAETGASNTTDQAALPGEPGNPQGIVRELRGTRSYSWESDDSTLPYGLLRALSSPDRQYLAQPTWEAPVGVIREWHTSVLAVMLWEVVIEDHPKLEETDAPTMIPAQLQKYLRWYVLWRCFSRQGEGFRPDLAAWCEQRWLRGIALMQRLGSVTRRDRGYGREGQSPRGRAVPRPRLPSDFPRYVGV